MRAATLALAAWVDTLELVQHLRKAEPVGHRLAVGEAALEIGLGKLQGLLTILLDLGDRQIASLGGRIPMLLDRDRGDAKRGGVFAYQFLRGERTVTRI